MKIPYLKREIEGFAMLVRENNRWLWDDPHFAGYAWVQMWAKRRK